MHPRLQAADKLGRLKKFKSNLESGKDSGKEASLFINETANLAAQVVAQEELQRSMKASKAKKATAAAGLRWRRKPVPSF